MDFFPERFRKALAPKGDLMPAGDLLMAVWRDYLAHFRTYLPLAGLTLLAYPFMAAGTALTVVGVQPDSTILTDDPKNFPLYFLLMLLGVAIVVVTNITAHVGLNVSVANGGKPTSLAEAARITRRLFWPFAGTIVLLYVAITLGFALLFFPGIIVGTFLIFAEPIAAIEELGPIESLKRSVALVTGRFWPVLWRIVVGYVVIALVSLVISYPLVQMPNAAFGRLFGESLIGLRIAVAGTMLISAVITALVMPLFVSLQVHLYQQLKKLPHSSS